MVVEDDEAAGLHPAITFFHRGTTDGVRDDG
jgi:hypothetical protein